MVPDPRSRSRKKARGRLLTLLVAGRPRCVSWGKAGAVAREARSGRRCVGARQSRSWSTLGTGRHHVPGGVGIERGDLDGGRGGPGACRGAGQHEVRGNRGRRAVARHAIRSLTGRSARGAWPPAGRPWPRGGRARRRSTRRAAVGPPAWAANDGAPPLVHAIGPFGWGDDLPRVDAAADSRW